MRRGVAALVCKTCEHLERWHEQKLACVVDGCRCTKFVTLRGGNKRNAIRVGGYASKLEYQRARDLHTLQRGGAIQNLQEQRLWNVAPEDCEPIWWRVDYQYEEDGKLIVEDAKGMVDEAFTMKARLFRHKYPHIPLRLSTRGRGKGINIEDTQATLRERRKGQAA